MDALVWRPLLGTEGAGDWPIWSPDSRFIAFEAHGKLKKIEATGGPALTLCDAPAGVLGGTWSRDDKIVFGPFAGLREVAASGGSPSAITTIGASFPSFLPDGRHFVYWGPVGDGIDLGSVDAKPNELPLKKLLPNDGGMAFYAPTSDTAVGYLLFARGTPTFGTAGALMAQSFDARRFELTGEAIPIAEQVLNVEFSASATDALVYGTGSQAFSIGGVRGTLQGQLTWFDRSGKVLGTVGDPGVYRTLSLSPDQKRVAFERVDPENPGIRNIWLYEFALGVTTRFTFASAWDSYPVWSPDGSRIAFSSNRSGGFDLYQKASSLAGEDELLFNSDDLKFTTSWSPDAHLLLYYTVGASSRIWSLPLGGGGAEHKPVLIDNSKFNQVSGHFSPDGRWIAYPSDESGRDQIYVRPFDVSSATGTAAGNKIPATGKWMVSKDGGTNPHWSQDGRELFYLSSQGGMMMVVSVSTSGVFQAGIPKPLFKVPAGVLFYDVSVDNKRFLMAAPSVSGKTPAAQPKITVVLNWPSLLKK